MTASLLPAAVGYAECSLGLTQNPQTYTEWAALLSLAAVGYAECFQPDGKRGR